MFVDGNVLKDLSLLHTQRDPNSIIMVDNKESGVLQMDHVVPITDFVGDCKEDTLKHLTDYLLSFAGETDVRDKIAHDF